jgi:hypothetical protein
MLKSNSFLVMIASTEADRENVKALQDYFEDMYFAN